MTTTTVRGPRAAARRALATILAFLAAAAWCEPAPASVLTFEIFDPTLYGGSEDFPEAIPFFGGPLNGYGSRITGPAGIHHNGTTTFAYGEEGEGYTPNVVVHYGPYSIFTGGPELWRYDFGDLKHVLYQGSFDTGIPYNYDILDIVLVADAGFDVVLHDFDLGGWMNDYPVNSVTVFNGVPFPFLTPTNAIAPTPIDDVIAPANGQLTVDFGGTPLQAPVIWIRIDASNLGDDSINVGIDNIRFSQTRSDNPGALDPAVIDAAFQSAEVPEATSLATWLLGGGAVLAYARARRRFA